MSSDNNYHLCDEDKLRGACQWFDIYPPDSMPKLQPYLQKVKRFEPPIGAKAKGGFAVPSWIVNFNSNIHPEVVEGFGYDLKPLTLLAVIILLIILAYYL